MKAKQKVVITARDLEILQFIFEQRAVSFKQLAKRFFPNAIFQAAHARLEKLTVAKYLEKSLTIWNGSHNVVYGITGKGIKAFSENYRHQITKPDFKSDSVNHDLSLVVARERLEKAKTVVNYFSESMLQNCPDLSESEKFKEFSIANSDAALAIDKTKSQFQVAFELEISIKEQARYVKKLREYYLLSKVALVLYVCGNAKIEKLVHAADLEIGNKRSKVFTCLEEVFYKSEEYLPFINRNNDIFKLE